MRIKRNQKTKAIINFTSITSFQKKIAENLANYSAAPTDEFMLVEYKHNYSEFECELCGHKHCVREFVVENIATEKKMSIGSECINHFQDKGIDIDLALGLMKRVEKATGYARNNAKIQLGIKAWEKLSFEEKKKIYKWYTPDSDFVSDTIIIELGKKEFNKLSKAEKNKITIEAYIIYQAKQLLLDFSWNKTVLTEKQIKDIINLGLEEELERAQERNKQYKKR